MWLLYTNFYKTSLCYLGNSFVSLELVKPCLNSDLCTFVHHSLLASGRNKPVNWELLSCSWNSAEIQKYVLKCPTRFLKVYSSISPNSSWVSSLWQTIKPDAEFCGACLREDSISGSRLQLFDLFSQETGKKEEKNEEQVLGWSTAIFTSLCAFQQERWFLPQRQKAIPAPQHSMRVWQQHVSRWCMFSASWDCSRGVMSLNTGVAKCKCATNLASVGLQIYSDLEYLAKSTAAGTQLYMVLSLWCLHQEH